MNTSDPIGLFDQDRANRLLGTLRLRNVMPEDELQAYVHALVDIAESTRRIYRELVPRMLDQPSMPLDVLNEHIWDIREEFRHMDYHVHDAKLVDG